MPFSLSLEVEAGFYADGLLACALASGAVRLEDDDDGVAVFPGSGLTVEPVPSGQVHVLTEGLPAMRWRVGLRALLTYDLDRNEACHRDVVTLLRTLEQRSGARFVLSFQFETPYAVRDERGLRLMPDTGLPA